MPEKCCGHSLGQNWEISGGNNVIPNEFPWIVYILGGCAEKDCAGSLVSPRIVASARHCAVSLTHPSPFQFPCNHMDERRRAYLGVHMFDPNMLESYYSIPIIDVKIPTLFPNTGAEFNDFAIFILKTPAVYSRNVQPICLPEPYEEFFNERAITAGWGMYKFNSSLSSVPKKVTLTTSPTANFQCKLIPTLITKTHHGEWQDPCSGDSGIHTIARTTLT